MIFARTDAVLVNIKCAINPCDAINSGVRNIIFDSAHILFGRIVSFELSVIHQVFE